MKYPSKLETIMTKACQDLHHAENIGDVDSVISMLEVFDPIHYPVPDWLLAWIQITKKHPLLTAEEYFKMPKPSLCPGLDDIIEKHLVNNKENERLELRKLGFAIHAAGCDGLEALKNCAYIIASLFINNPSGSDAEFGDDLAYEWHCGIGYTDSLYNPNNYSLLVKLLRRETEFWQSDVRPSIKRKGPKLQPLAMI